MPDLLHGRPRAGPVREQRPVYLDLLDEAGADGLVLFNRFLQPDIDPETLTVVPALDLPRPR